MKLILGVVLSTILICSFIPGVFATGSVNLGSIKIGKISVDSKKLIGVEFDQTGLTLLKNGQSCNGLTYQNLTSLNNANSPYSGIWVAQPYYHRENAKVPNSEILYNLPYLIFLDPTGDYSAKARMIIIKCEHFSYIKKNEDTINGTRIDYQDRYVSKDCNNALVFADFKLINDTINYFENNCTKSTYQEKHTTSLIIAKSVYSSPYASYNTYNYYAKIFNGKTQLHNENIPTDGGQGLGNCITKSCPYQDPYKKAGY